MLFTKVLFLDLTAITIVVVATFYSFFLRPANLSLKRFAYMFGVFCALYLFASALSGSELRVYGGSVFILLSAVSALLIFVAARRDIQRHTCEITMSSRDLQTGFVLVFFGVLFLSYFASGVTAGPIGDLMHHYDVFQFYYRSVRNGLVPYYDFPVQYGAGPLLLAILGAKTIGTLFAVTGLLNALYAALLFGIATNGGNVSRVRGGISALAVVVLCVLFAAFPGLGAITSFYPSIGGLRYLPIAMAAYALIRNPQMSWGTTAAWVIFTSTWSLEAGLMTMIGLGMRYFAQRKIWSLSALVFPFLIGLAVGPTVAFMAFHQLDWTSVLEFIGGSVPHSLTSRFYTITVALIALIFVPLFYGRADNDRPFLAGFFLALFVYPAMRGHPTTFLNVSPFIFALALNVASNRLPKTGNVLSILAVLIAFVPYVQTPARLLPQFEAKQIIKTKAQEIVDRDRALEVATTEIMGCKGLWVSNVGVPRDDEPDLNKRTSVWTLLPDARVAMYQERQDQNSGRSVDRSYCWMEMPPHVAVNFERIAKDLGLTERNVTQSGRVLFFSPDQSVAANRVLAKAPS